MSPEELAHKLRHVVERAEAVTSYEAARRAILTQWPTAVLADFAWTAAPDHVCSVAFAELRRRGYSR